MAMPQEFFDLNRFFAPAGRHRLFAFYTLNGHGFLCRSVEEIEQHADVTAASPHPYILVDTVYHLFLELRSWLQRTDIGITLADTITSGYLSLTTWLTCRAWYFFQYHVLWRNLFVACMGESQRLRSAILGPDGAVLPDDLLDDSNYCFARIERISTPTDRGYDSDSSDNPYYLHQEAPEEYVQYRHALRRDASRQLLLLIQWLQGNGHGRLYIDFHYWMEDAFFCGLSPLRSMLHFCAEDVLMCRMPLEMAALDLPDADTRFDMGWLEVEAFDYLRFLNAAPVRAARNVRHEGWMPPAPFP